jgi:hypothetical protein
MIAKWFCAAAHAFFMAFFVYFFTATVDFYWK